MIISQCFMKCKKVERERERERDENNQSCSQITETILIFRKLEKKKKKEEGKENYITNQGPIFFFIPYSAEYE